MSKVNKRPQPVSNEKKSQKPVIQKKKSNFNYNNQESVFFNCLTDPFDPKSLGAQVPDPFPFPTETFHIHQTSVIGSPTSSSITSGGLLLLPNPILSMVDLQHSTSLTSANISVQNTPMTSYSTTNTNAASCIYGATSVTNLNTLFSTWRVVSWGVKISNLQPELSATGRLMIAQVPIGDTVPSYADLLYSTTSNVFTPITGISSGALNSSVILELPTAFEVTVGDLLHGDLEIGGMYTNSTFWQFKSSLNGGANQTGVTMGDDFSINTSTSALVAASYKDLTRMCGGSAIVLYYEGIPNTANNAFQIETIYHIEGTPNFSSSSNNALVPSVSPKAYIGSSSSVERAMSRASKLDKVVHFIERGANFLQKNKKTLKLVGSTAAALML